MLLHMINDHLSVCYFKLKYKILAQEMVEAPNRRPVWCTAFSSPSSFLIKHSLALSNTALRPFLY